MTDSIVLKFTAHGLRQLIELEEEQIRMARREHEIKREEINLLSAEIAGHKAQIRIYERALAEREGSE